ncbi:MAG TPA: hypothetical protein VJ851_00785 [Jatrophihabitans sp.]|nr:hypothetical protein [Jatrophihabitans sp.]
MSVNRGLTLKRRTAPGATQRRRAVENGEYVAFLTRAIRAGGRRVADGDIEALAGLADLSAELDSAITHAVNGLRAEGYSWAEIAARLGTTKQNVQQRWGAA